MNLERDGRKMEKWMDGEESREECKKKKSLVSRFERDASNVILREKRESP